MTKIDNFEENCEILEGICEEYGLNCLKCKVSHSLVGSLVLAPDHRCYTYFDRNSLSNPNWGYIRDEVLSLLLNYTFL